LLRDGFDSSHQRHRHQAFHMALWEETIVIINGH
jgi:hypothetical protein